ncbi:unnamed protein product [Callosobruchus maculatus]|uniref:Uncharacterized protein n=1 Tax=Callosobruchus maculatus TaxID=64391 RepID=A0A653DM00_CALMS|nr:unnamed protein product [Callosobruchus maculatus]
MKPLSLYDISMNIRWNNLYRQKFHPKVPRCL